MDRPAQLSPDFKKSKTKNLVNDSFFNAKERRLNESFNLKDHRLEKSNSRNEGSGLDGFKSESFYRTQREIARINSPRVFLSVNPVKNFIPRSIVDQIRAELFHKYTSHVTSKLVIWGPGGVGKSQIALEYVRRYQAKYMATYWIDTGCRESLDNRYIYLYESLKDSSSNEIGVSSVEEAVKNVKNHFTSGPGPWLIVFDGADISEDEEGSQYVDVEQLIPNRANLHVIITARSDMTKSMARTKGVVVGGMEEAQALELFFKKSQVQRHNEVENEVQNIVQKLKMLPLSITLAATYISSISQLVSDISGFLPNYEHQIQKVLQQTSTDLVIKYTESFLTTYEMCQYAIAKQNSLASTFLTMISFYSFDDILPQILLNSSKEVERLADVTNIPKSPSLNFLVESLKTLVESSFLQWRDERLSFSMNRLVYTWGYDRLSKAERRKFCYGTFRVIAKEFIRNWNRSLDIRRLVPHVMANFRKFVKNNCDPNSDEEILFNLLAKVGRIMSESEFLREGCMIERYVFKESSRFFGEEHLETIKAMNCLALTLKKYGHLNEAERIFREVIDIRQRVVGESHPDTIKTLSNLATTLKSKGRHDEAENYFFTALNRCRGLLVPELSLCRGLIGNIMSVREIRIIGLETNNNKVRHPLDRAILWNDLNLVKSFIGNRANAGIQSAAKAIALQKASYLGNCEVVKLILDSEIDVNVKSGLYGNALQSASRSAAILVIRMLLDNGADVNINAGLFGTALQAASRNGYQMTLQILLDAGANVNAQGGHYGNALQAASSEGDLIAVKLLLDAGANVNAEGGLYGSALQASSSRGSEEIVQQLLDSGADVNLQGGPYGNALQASLSRGNSKVVAMLVAAGAHGYIQNGLFYEAFQKVSDEHRKLFQILLEHEIDLGLSIAINFNKAWTKIEMVSKELRRLFYKDSRFESLMPIIGHYSCLNQDRLANILQRVIFGYIQNFVNELQPKRHTACSEAYKFILYHSRLLSNEIARLLYDDARPDPLSLHPVQASRSDRLLSYKEFKIRYFLPRRRTRQASPSLRTIDYVNNTPAANGGRGYTNDDLLRAGIDFKERVTFSLDQQNLIKKGLLELFEPNRSLSEVFNCIWQNVQPELFDWTSISIRWREELGEPVPTNLSYLPYGDIVTANEEVVSFSDKVKLSLEQFTAKPWDWWPFVPPKHPIARGKMRLQWNILQIFDVSHMLADKVKKYTQVPVRIRKNSTVATSGLSKIQETNHSQPNDSSQINYNAQAGLPHLASSTAESSLSSKTHSSSFPTVSSQSSTNLKEVRSSERRYRFVLLCVRNMYGPDSLQHSQIEITKDMTDNMFFQEFRRKYRTLRGRFYWLHYDQFWFCHCSRFYKWDFDKVAWENHEMPKDECYVFIPKPPLEPYSLPVSRDEWEHRYHRNCSFGGDDFLNRIPKRDRRFEIDTCTNPHQIWGLKVEYRVSVRVVLAWLICFISPGILFFIVWVVHFSKDLQNASVPALFLVAFMGIILSLANVRFK